MVAKLDKVLHDIIILSGWKKSLGAFVSLENDHNYGGLAPTQILRDLSEISGGGGGEEVENRGELQFFKPSKREDHQKNDSKRERDIQFNLH